MNILVITEYFPVSKTAELTGGIESRSFHLLKEVAKNHNVTIICSYQGKPQKRESLVSGIKVLRVGPKVPYSNNYNIFGRLGFAWSAFFKSTELKDIDIIHGYSYLTYLIAGKSGFLTGTPRVATYHEDWNLNEWVKLKGLIVGPLGFIWTSLAKIIPFTRIIAVSETTKKRLIHHGMSKKKIDVVYNGVEVSQFKKIKAKPTKSPSIITISRLTNGKRVDVLIKAIAEVKKSIPDVKLTIVGVGPEMENLQALTNKLGVQKNINFTGKINAYKDLLKEVKKNKVFATASEVEGFGIVVIEGMASDLPVVCTDITVFKEITKNGTGSLIFRAGDHKDLAKKLEQLLSDKKLYSKKKAEASKHAKNFEWSALASQLETVYKKIIS
jgi:glycosyltransferase involved in cell wall biosynthesis